MYLVHVAIQYGLRHDSRPIYLSECKLNANAVAVVHAASSNNRPTGGCMQTLTHSWSKLSITAFLSASVIICLKFLCSITEQRNGTSVTLYCLSVDRAPFQDQQTAGCLYCWHRSTVELTSAAQGRRSGAPDSLRAGLAYPPADRRSQVPVMCSMPPP